MIMIIFYPTLAHVLIRRFDIVNVLPVLVVYSMYMTLATDHADFVIYFKVTLIYRMNCFMCIIHFFVILIHFR